MNSRKKVNRRRFLGISAGAIVGAGAANVGLTSAFAASSSYYAGVLLAVQYPDTVVIDGPSGRRTIHFENAGVATTFNRDGASGLDKFSTGDRVVAELSGRSAGRALRLESVYNYSRGRVTARDRDTITLDGVTRTRLAADTAVRRSRITRIAFNGNSILVGDEVGVTALYDPALRERVARLVFVYEG